MKIILFSLLLYLGLSNLMAQEEAVVLQTPTGDIYGTLLTPERNNNLPVVLLIAGSGPTDRNGNNPLMTNNSLKMLAELLAKNGIASLRYDKRGISASAAAGKEESVLRLEDYVKDVKAWSDFLKKDKGFTKIILAGHSEGSLIGMLAAIDNPTISQFISLAGSGERMSDLLRRQLASQPQPVIDLCMPIIDKLEKGDTVANPSPLLYSLFRPSVQPYLISCFKYNPCEEISRLHIPVLILQGDHDIQCSVEDAEALAKAYPRAEKHIIQGMSHVMKDCNTLDKFAQIDQVYNNPALPLNTQLGEMIIRFIKK
ncbi:alpha/beta hydrolase [Odoribacter laneus]|uniref:alpha/beta hydrolase n=1 Tax=Odoribacter laneus TaxID=626933 RepID=UPI00399622F0